MESTGVYWVPVFEVLRRRGIEVIVVNAREARMCPAARRDVNDAQWLQRLHAYGLLRAQLPTRATTSPRCEPTCVSARGTVDYAAAHIQHMQKALTLMNLQLHHVVSDITGVTG